MLKLNILYLTQKIINKLKNDIIYTFDTGGKALYRTNNVI